MAVPILGQGVCPLGNFSHLIPFLRILFPEFQHYLHIPLSVIKRDIPPYLHYMTFQTTQTKYFLKAYDVHYQLTHHHSLVTQIQIHKYTNTQIQLWLKLNIGTTCAIFLKRLWYEDLKNNVHEYLMCKYTYTNTQIYKYTNTQVNKYSFGQSFIQT